MLKIGEVWITGNYDYHIHFASRGPIIRKYCMQRHKWNATTMDKIDFCTVERVRRKQKFNDQVRSMKVMPGWLPVKHILGKYSKDGITQCPGCPCEDETFLHMYACTHSLMQRAVEDALEQIHKLGCTAKIPHIVMDKFVLCIQAGIRAPVLTVASAIVYGSPYGKFSNLECAMCAASAMSAIENMFLPQTPTILARFVLVGTPSFCVGVPSFLVI